jgi:hypothetical protein
MKQVFCFYAPTCAPTLFAFMRSAAEVRNPAPLDRRRTSDMRSVSSWLLIRSSCWIRRSLTTLISMPFRIRSSFFVSIAWWEGPVLGNNPEANALCIILASSRGSAKFAREPYGISNSPTLYPAVSNTRGLCLCGGHVASSGHQRGSGVFEIEGSAARLPLVPASSLVFSS